MKKEILVVILGPTATGKTQLSLQLAHEFRGEILSADSMQIYKGMNIGTATPSKDERKGIPHYFLSSIPPCREFSVADFQREARFQITMINKRGGVPFLVGGSGLYIRATLENFVFPSLKKDKVFHRSCQEILRREGSHHLHRRLKEIDAKTAEIIHPNDSRRITRALEIYHQTGKTPSFYRKKAKETPSLYKTLKIGLTASREVLYRRIEERVQRMLEKGLVDEVRGLLEDGYHCELVSMQSLGYREIAAYLEGRYDYNEAVRLIKRNTRHFAKRQLTWFKKEKDVHWFPIDQKKRGEIFKESSYLVEEFLSH